MPSLHVASSVLFALLAWRVNRWLGLLLTVFALFIQVGSVKLGWHYALDGYVGAVTILLIWHVAKKIIGPMQDLSSPIIARRGAR